MTLLLSPCVLWISTCISFLSADSVISVSAPLNSTVLLPCNFTPDPSQTPHVRWTIGSETVFERRGKRIYQGKGYEYRVDVPEDELLKGNCSLVLKNIRATDAYIYNSYMAVNDIKRYEHWDFVQNVKLKIDETKMRDKETPQESQSGRRMNSPNTLMIISSVIPCVSIGLLAIIAIIIFSVYRRMNINSPSNQTAPNSNVYDERRVSVDFGIALRDFYHCNELYCIDTPFQR